MTVEIGQIINGWELCSMTEGQVYRLAKGNDRLIVSQNKEYYDLEVFTRNQSISPFLPIISSSPLTALEQATLWADGETR